VTGQINVNKIAARTGNTITINSGDKISGAAGSIVAPGQIIQVVTASDAVERTLTSSSFVAASNTLSVSITPSSASNKIFVTCSLSYGSPSGTHSFFATLYRGSTNLGTANGFGNLFSGSSYHYAHATLQILDSPNTTSSVTYQPYFRVGSGTGRINNSASVSTITAFEVVG
tara:strand:- start:44 stop:559 length:516 start_codon:yes stop_codon:yes gene_type:complete